MNDPMAVFLTIGLTRLLTNPQESVFTVMVLFVQQMGVGAICGLVLGWGARRPARLAAVAALGSTLVAASARRAGHDRAVAALLPAALVAAHAAYGSAFVRGLFDREHG